MTVTVQLPDTDEITTMDDSELERRVFEIDDEREHTVVTEYWLPGYTVRAVHRSVNMRLKQSPALFSDAGSVG